MDDINEQIENTEHLINSHKKILETFQKLRRSYGVDENDQDPLSSWK